MDKIRTHLLLLYQADSNKGIEPNDATICRETTCTSNWKVIAEGEGGRRAAHWPISLSLWIKRVNGRLRKYKFLTLLQPLLSKLKFLKRNVDQKHQPWQKSQHEVSTKQILHQENKPV